MDRKTILFNNPDRSGEQTTEEILQTVYEALEEKGYEFAITSPTNQIFIKLEKSKAKELAEYVELGFWENIDDSHVVMRIATSWATQPEDVDSLIALL